MGRTATEGIKERQGNALKNAKERTAERNRKAFQKGVMTPRNKIDEIAEGISERRKRPKSEAATKTGVRKVLTLDY